MIQNHIKPVSRWNHLFVKLISAKEDKFYVGFTEQEIGFLRDCVVENLTEIYRVKWYDIM